MTQQEREEQKKDEEMNKYFYDELSLSDNDLLVLESLYNKILLF